MQHQYLTPEQVKGAIADWFAQRQQPELGQQLVQRLYFAENNWILDTVRNPFLVSLWCQCWELNPEEIPETKADLYDRISRTMYANQENELAIALLQQQALNQKLAELALRGIVEDIPLCESLVASVLGEQFQFAKDVGWLGEGERETNELVYVFCDRLPICTRPKARYLYLC